LHARSTLQALELRRFSQKEVTDLKNKFAKYYKQVKYSDEVLDINKIIGAPTG
jgi:hypothetical protein